MIEKERFRRDESFERMRALEGESFEGCGRGVSCAAGRVKGNVRK